LVKLSQNDTFATPTRTRPPYRADLSRQSQATADSLRKISKNKRASAPTNALYHNGLGIQMKIASSFIAA
jgi:hypothetical protein